jgi:hypothetical protein
VALALQVVGQQVPVGLVVIDDQNRARLASLARSRILGQGADRTHHVFYHGRRVLRRGEGLQTGIGLGGLRRRKAHDVVNERQEALACVVDPLQVRDDRLVPLVLGILDQHLDVADDGIQRRAQLVAQGGAKGFQVESRQTGFELVRIEDLVDQDEKLVARGVDALQIGDEVF